MIENLMFNCNFNVIGETILYAYNKQKNSMEMGGKQAAPPNLTSRAVWKDSWEKCDGVTGNNEIWGTCAEACTFL